MQNHWIHPPFDSSLYSDSSDMKFKLSMPSITVGRCRSFPSQLPAFILPSRSLRRIIRSLPLRKILVRSHVDACFVKEAKAKPPNGHFRRAKSRYAKRHSWNMRQKQLFLVIELKMEILSHCSLCFPNCTYYTYR